MSSSSTTSSLLSYWLYDNKLFLCPFNTFQIPEHPETAMDVYKNMTAMPKREIFERIIQNITSKFPDVYAALFISPEGFPINTWGVTLERAEEISALLSALIGKTWEIVKGVKEGGELAFIQIQTNMGGIRIAPQEEFILVTLTRG